MWEQLLFFNLDLIVIQIISHLDFPSTRTCLWVNNQWRRFIIENWTRLGLDDKENEYNMQNGLVHKFEIRMPSFHHLGGDKYFHNLLFSSVISDTDLEGFEDMPSIEGTPMRHHKSVMSNDHYLLTPLGDKLLSIDKRSKDASLLDYPCWHPCKKTIAPRYHFTSAYRDFLCVQVKDFVRIYKMSADAKSFACWHEFSFSEKNPKVEDGALALPPYDKNWKNTIRLSIGRNYHGQTYLMALNKTANQMMFQLVDLDAGETLWENEIRDAYPSDIIFFHEVVFGSDFVAASVLYQTKGKQKGPGSKVLIVFNIKDGRILREESFREPNSFFVPKALSFYKQKLLLIDQKGDLMADVSCHLLEAKGSKTLTKNLPLSAVKEEDSCFLNSAALCSNVHVVTNIGAFIALFLIWQFRSNADDAFCVRRINLSGFILNSTSIMTTNGATWILEDVNNQEKKEDEPKNYLWFSFKKSIQSIF